MYKLVHVRWLALLLAGLLIGASAFSQDYPTKPIRLLVGFPPGGATDGIARAVAMPLGLALGQPIVVDNRPGSGGTLATATAAQAKPDGYTLLLATSSAISIAPALYRKLQYDSQKDFTPIGLVAQVPQVLVAHPAATQEGLSNLVKAATASPGGLSYASAGNGTSQHLTMEMFKRKAGIDVVHVPYKGSAPAGSDLIGGQIPLWMDTLQATLPFIQSGKARALAISTSKRSALAPDIPTFAELGYPELSGFSAWYGVMAPAGLSAPVLQKLATAIDKIARDPSVQAQLVRLGAEPRPLVAAPLADFLASEQAKWEEAVKVSGAQLD